MEREEKRNKEEEMILNNMGLVYYCAKKLNIIFPFLEQEEIVSFGMIGLIKAARTFDSSKNIAFATYAAKCINNEILMYCRKENRHAKEISIDEPLGADDEGNDFTLRDKIPYPYSDFAETILKKEECAQIIEVILNYLQGKNRIIVLYRLGGIQQKEIAEKLQISQSYVSRLEVISIRKIRKAIEQNVYYKHIISVELADEKYRITFPFVYVAKTKNNLKRLQKLNAIKTSEKITIQLTAQPESFYYIGKIIQEIEEQKAF